MPQLGHSGGRKLVKLSRPDSHEAQPWLAQPLVSRSLEMAFSESSFLLFVIIEIRTLDMVFKCKNFFDPPPLSLR